PRPQSANRTSVPAHVKATAWIAKETELSDPPTSPHPGHSGPDDRATFVPLGPSPGFRVRAALSAPKLPRASLCDPWCYASIGFVNTKNDDASRSNLRSSRTLRRHRSSRPLVDRPARYRTRTHRRLWVSHGASVPRHVRLVRAVHQPHGRATTVRSRRGLSRCSSGQ